MTLADELRKQFGLPTLDYIPDKGVIRKLKGMMRKYTDDEESCVDAIKQSREDDGS